MQESSLTGSAYLYSKEFMVPILLHALIKKVGGALWRRGEKKGYSVGLLHATWPKNPHFSLYFYTVHQEQTLDLPFSPLGEKWLLSSAKSRNEAFGESS